MRDETFCPAIRDHAPDLGVVAAFGRILPDALLAIPRLGMINVHASLLPKYRGAAPMQRAVLAGEAETGVTIMRVVNELDAGPTFAMTSTPIHPDETSGAVEARLAEIGAAALMPVVEGSGSGARDRDAAGRVARDVRAEGHKGRERNRLGGGRPDDPQQSPRAAALAAGVDAPGRRPVCPAPDGVCNRTTGV